MENGFYHNEYGVVEIKDDTIRLITTHYVSPLYEEDLERTTKSATLEEALVFIVQQLGEVWDMTALRLLYNQKVFADSISSVQIDNFLEVVQNCSKIVYKNMYLKIKQ